MARPGGRLVRAAAAAAGTYGRIAGGQRAAAIAYHVLFSLVPFFALLLAVLDLVLPDTTEARVVGWLVQTMPLPDDLSRAVEGALEDAGTPGSVAGFVALLGLLWTASGMAASVRSAFRAVWASEADRPYLRRKALDLALVLSAGLLVVCAFGVSLALQLATDTGTEIARDLGGGGSVTTRLGAAGQLAASAGLTFVAFALVYRVVPPVATRLRDVLPGALVATVGFEAAGAGFAVYLDRFADFDDVYGPLGAILAFLTLVYLTGAILIVGACLVAAWPAAEHAPPPAAAGDPLAARLLRAARGLVARQ